MAINFIEGFDHYTNFDTQYHGKWNARAGTNTLSTGRCSGKSLLVSDHITFATKNPYQAYIVVGVAAYFLSFDWIYIGSRKIIAFNGAGNLATMDSLCVDSQGRLFWQEMVNNTFAPHAITSDCIVTERWHYLELQLNIADTTVRQHAGNWVKIYIDGVQSGYETGVPVGDIHWNNAPYTIAEVQLWGPASATPAEFYDDMYIMDDNPAGKTNPLGDQRVITVFPTADDVVQFTPSAGVDNWEMVNDPGPDEDATYNWTGDTGKKDLFVHETISGITGAVINAMQISARTRKTDVGTRTISPLVHVGASESTHVPQAIPNDYRYRYEVFEKNPNGNIDWDTTTINTAKVGYQAD